MGARSCPGLGFDPAPGDKAAVQSVLESFVDVGSKLGPCASRMQEALEVTDDWDGDAADDFHDYGDDLPAAFESGAKSLGAAGEALATWYTQLSANQDQADDLDRTAQRLRERLAEARDDLQRAEQAWSAASESHAGRMLGRMVDAQEAVTGLETGLDAVIDKANRLRDKHLRQAEATAERIDGAADDAFEPENDGWTVQLCDGIAKASSTISLVSGTIAIGLAATGVGAPAAAVLGTVAAASNGVSLVAGVGQKATGSANAPSWGELGLNAVPVTPLVKGAKAAKAVHAATSKNLGKVTRVSAATARRRAVGDGVDKAVREAKDAVRNHDLAAVGKAREQYRAARRHQQRHPDRSLWDGHKAAERSRHQALARDEAGYGPRTSDIRDRGAELARQAGREAIPEHVIRAGLDAEKTVDNWLGEPDHRAKQVREELRNHPIR